MNEKIRFKSHYDTSIGGNSVKKCICIPVEQYERMLATYDKVVEELEKMKKALEKLANSTKSKQPGPT